MLQIGLVNQSTKVNAADFAAVRMALQIQVTRDFAPAWDTGATLVARNSPRANEPTLILLDNPTIAGALGYHDLTPRDVPIGYVFVQTAQDNGVSWQSVLSHELLEMLADPLVYTVADTLYQGKETLVAVEVADPVESDSYLIDGIEVSNFVLPSWFLPGPIPGSPHTDFLKHVPSPLTITPGGYFSFATVLGQWQQVFGDKARTSSKAASPFDRLARRKVKQ